MYRYIYNIIICCCDINNLLAYTYQKHVKGQWYNSTIARNNLHRVPQCVSQMLMNFNIQFQTQIWKKVNCFLFFYYKRDLTSINSLFTAASLACQMGSLSWMKQSFSIAQWDVCKCRNICKGQPLKIWSFVPTFLKLSFKSFRHSKKNPSWWYGL